MKFILLICSLLFLHSCYESQQQIHTKLIKPKITITDIYIGKYSRVHGYFDYDGVRFIVSNPPGQGYYYKRFNLVCGQTIEQPILLYYFRDGANVVIQCSHLDAESYQHN